MVVSIERDGAANVRRALERCIDGGGIAVFPADTLYGLACDPSNGPDIDRLHALKGRESGKPSAVMFFTPLAMRELLTAVGPRTREAIGALLPGPVTLVVDNPQHRYPLACREDPERLGLRLIEGPLAGARCAVFQTSANPSGGSAPSRFSDVDARIVGEVDLADRRGQAARRAVDGRRPHGPGGVRPVVSASRGSALARGAVAPPSPRLWLTVPATPGLPRGPVPSPLRAWRARSHGPPCRWLGPTPGRAPARSRSRCCDRVREASSG